ncbi:MAG: hypothetical protein LBM60_03125 [Clostridium sp.]|jgi:hypothetical protein|nr:hypothetical protein [Clostridium sp.]
MAIGALEMTTISRSQDVAAVRHNEANKTFVDQSHIGQVQTKEMEQMARQVHTSDNADWQRKKQDAKEKGKNEYAGDGGKNRRPTAHPVPQKTTKDGVLYHGFDAKV